MASKLNHPKTVTIHEVGVYQGRPFFAMEHIESQTLCDIIKEEKPSLDKIIDLTTQVYVLNWARLVEYNEQRPLTGKYYFGKTPMATFIDTVPLAKEKILNSTLQTETMVSD